MLLVLLWLPPPTLLEASATFSAFSSLRSSTSVHAYGGRSYVFRVFHILESALVQYDVTFGRPEKHYRVRLIAAASSRKDAGAAADLHSQLLPTAVLGNSCPKQQLQLAV